MLKYFIVLRCGHEVCELKKTFCRNVLSKNVYSTMITLYIYMYIYIYNIYMYNIYIIYIYNIYNAYNIYIYI